MDHLYAINDLCDFVAEKKIPSEKLVVVSPDVGSLKMARAYAKKLGASLAVVDKRRTGPETTEVMHILGDVEGKIAILVDDIVATGGSLVEAGRGAEEAGGDQCLGGDQSRDLVRECPGTYSEMRDLKRGHHHQQYSVCARE